MHCASSSTMKTLLSRFDELRLCLPKSQHVHIFDGFCLIDLGLIQALAALDSVVSIPIVGHWCCALWLVLWPITKWQHANRVQSVKIRLCTSAFMSHPETWYLYSQFTTLKSVWPQSVERQLNAYQASHSPNTKGKWQIQQTCLPNTNKCLVVKHEGLRSLLSYI